MATYNILLQSNVNPANMLFYFKDVKTVVVVKIVAENLGDGQNRI
jgi:hypothetical protein